MPTFLTAVQQSNGEGGFLAWTRPMSRYSRHRLFNLTRPEQSLVLLAALAEQSGGLANASLPAPELRKPIHENKGQPPQTICHPIVFENSEDKDYLAILHHLQQGKERLETIKRFDMPGFVPNEHYVREMKRYGVLPLNFDPNTNVVDVYDWDRRYWSSVIYPYVR
jgi:hypothetical protein